MKTEWQLAAERLLYRYGKKVLGKNAGGMIKKLIEAKGFGSAEVILAMADEKSDALEYVGGAIRNAPGPAIEISDEKFEELKARYQAKVARYG